MAIANTGLLNPIELSNVASFVPLAFKRIILFSVIPLYVVKLPPTSILPSVCIAIWFVLLLNPIELSNVASFVPLAFNRIILFAETPL